MHFAFMSSMAKRLRDVRKVREVWAWNYAEELEVLLAALSSCGHGALVALDTEFPGFLREHPFIAARNEQYQALRCSVDLLQPIQLGLALADVDGQIHGIWNFNFRFNMAVDLHTEAAMVFLSHAGVNFPLHAAEGISSEAFGQWLACSPLVQARNNSPWWVTFSGLYDLGYLLKLLTGKPLPNTISAFESALALCCPRRYELRDWLPHGSLESLLRDRRMERHGAAHTAGSDALATVELFLTVVGAAHRVESMDSVIRRGKSEATEFVAEPRGDAEVATAPAGMPLVGPTLVCAELLESASSPACEAPAIAQLPCCKPVIKAPWGAAARWAMIAANREDVTRAAAPTELWRVAARNAALDAKATVLVDPWKDLHCGVASLHYRRVVHVS